MLATIFFYFIAVFVAVLPVYFWGYISSMLLETPWNRRRFLLGMIIGGSAVAFVWMFSYLKNIEHLYIVLSWVFFIATLSIYVFFLIYRGSNIARVILQKVAIANILVIFFLLLTSIYVIGTYFPDARILLIVIMPLLISSLVEESSKHLMSIGLMSQDFRFSRSDIILFTIFVVLGFVFFENLLYLFLSDSSIGTWIFRSIFSLVAHILAATLCAYGWWRALSYPPFSSRYILYFSLGFILAVIVHLSYNYILEKGSVIGLFAYMIMAYVIVTQGILKK